MVVTWFINRLCFCLSPVALLVVCFYSFTKRFTDFSHFFLGLALGIAPLGAWLAVRGRFDWPPCVLAAAVVFWLVGFDIIYATQDYEFDKSQGLHSLPARLGIARKPADGAGGARGHGGFVAGFRVDFTSSRAILLGIGDHPGLSCRAAYTGEKAGSGQPERGVFSDECDH